MLEYVASVGPFMYSLQLLLSLVGTVVALYLVASQLIIVAASPIIGSVVVSAPSPADVAALFALQAASEGAITSLLCPCTVPSAPISTLSTWNVTEDPFCVAMRAAVQYPLPAAYVPPSAVNVTEFAAMLGAEENYLCLGTSEWATLLGEVSTMATDTSLFPPGPDFDTAVEALARQMQIALCGLAFGLVPPQQFFPVWCARRHDDVGKRVLVP